MKRFAAVMALGFSSGIPLLLTATTLQAWMVDQKVDLTVIGLFSLVGMPYTLKFLWSPLMDRYVPPFLGRRRGWMLVTQLALILFIAAMGLFNPSAQPALIALIALLITFASASQDIVVDAYNTEILKPSEYGMGSALYSSGYRVAMLVSGALALVMADHMSWRMVYLIMAATMLVGVCSSFFAPEPTISAKPPETLAEAIGAPLKEFFSRAGAWEILIFLVIYRIDYNMTWTMTTPFMMDIGFSKTDIGVVTKGFGLAATIIGALAGGGLIMKLGIWRALAGFGIAQALSGLSYTLLAHLGHHYPMMVAAIAVENFCGGMANAALSAFMMGLCDKRFTATQLALITSFMGLSRYAAGAPSGFLVKALGWPGFFIFSVFAGVPALLMLLRRHRWSPPSNA